MNDGGYDSSDSDDTFISDHGSLNSSQRQKNVFEPPLEKYRFREKTGLTPPP